MSGEFQISSRRPHLFFALLALPLFLLTSALYLYPRPPAAAPPPPPAQALLAAPSPASETNPGGFTDADFARHIEQLKKKIPGKNFTILIQSPFVVIGDGARASVASHAATVKWAVDKLKQDFFTKDPVEILDIWLFKDEASYRKHTREIFKDNPDTPYGYYSAAHKALIMNIETGGGTLVHEIVHPFIEANFPDCPPWLNEGLGSLYEQSGERDGHIRGFTNWRLPGLQEAIRAGLVPSFKALMAMDAENFYMQDKGTNYGQSRYLCYYLQERGLLVKFYKEFLADRVNDPTGYKTLQSVLNETDMDAFKKRWEKFVLGLQEGSG